jgi:hypothetical protein
MVDETHEFIVWHLDHNTNEEMYSTVIMQCSTIEINRN